MGVVQFIQTNFTAGIYGPLLEGHMDSPKRENAFSDSINVIPLPEGPVTRRGGTRFIWPFRHMNKRAELLPFVYNREQKFQIEIGDQYLRFHYNSGPVTISPKTVTDVTKANPAVVTANSHGYSNGDRVALAGVGGMWQVNSREFIVQVVTTNTFTLQYVDGTNVDSTGFDAYTSGGTASKIYEIVGSGNGAVWTLADLFNTSGLFTLSVVRQADTVYLFNKAYKPRALVRLSDASWTCSAVSFVDGPYLNTNRTATTLTCSGTLTPGGSATVTASSVTGINGGAGFQTTDVGRLIRIKNSTNWTWGTITAHSSTTVVTVLVDNTQNTINFPSAATNDWRLGAFSDTTGWPQWGKALEDKIFMGGGIQGQNGKVYSTEVGGYNQTQFFMAPTSVDGVVNPDNAINANIGSADDIVGFSDNEKGLMVMTGAAENLLRASDYGEALTATNARSRAASRRGSAPIPPMQASGSNLFVSSTRRKLYQSAYNYQTDGFPAIDVSIYASHLLTGKIARGVWQPEPFPIAWEALDDGSLKGFTYDKDNEIYAWHPHMIGGYANSEKTIPAFVETMSVIPSEDGGVDELWLGVKRHINGSTVRYMEVVTEAFKLDQVIEDSFHVDCGLTYDGAESATIRGLYHLEGQQVRVLVDGKAHPLLTVENGQITLANGRKGSKIQIGFPTVWYIRTLKKEAGSSMGSAQGREKKWNRITFRVLNTLGLRYGGVNGPTDEFVFDNLKSFDQKPEMLSGDTEELPWPEGIEKGGEIIVGHDGAFPATLQAIIGTLEVM